MSGNKPEWRRSLGLVSVAVFGHDNQREDGTTMKIRTVSCERRFFDKKSESWKSSHYLGASELGAALALLQAAQQYLIGIEAAGSQQDEF